MILPPKELLDKMTDAELKRWLIKEAGYDSESADFVIGIERGTINGEGVD